MAEYQLRCWKTNFLDSAHSAARRINTIKMGDFTADPDWDGAVYEVFTPGKRARLPATLSLQASWVYWDPAVATGTHTGSNNADTLTDSTKSWGTDALVGQWVYNTADGSYGAITANTATTITAILKGGAENDWDTGDAYAVRGYYAGTAAVAPVLVELRDHYQMREDFLGPYLNLYLWNYDGVGANSYIGHLDGDHGICQIRSGGSPGDYETLVGVCLQYRVSRIFRARFGVRVVDQSNLVAYVGFYKDASNLIHFKADFSDGYWHTVTISGGSSTDTATAVALDAAWHHLEMECRSGRVVFYLDGAMVAEHTTNVTEEFMYLRAQAARTGGSATREIHLDYVEVNGKRAY